MRELTPRQQEILHFIRAFSGEQGVPPTVREIGARFRITPRAAFDHLRALERKGELTRRRAAGRTSRALTLADGGLGRARGAGRALIRLRQALTVTVPTLTSTNTVTSSAPPALAV